MTENVKLLSKSVSRKIQFVEMKETAKINEDKSDTLNIPKEMYGMEYVKKMIV